MTVEDKKFDGREELKGMGTRARNGEKRAERRKRKRKKLTNIEKKSEEKSKSTNEPKVAAAGLYGDGTRGERWGGACCCLK